MVLESFRTAPYHPAFPATSVLILSPWQSDRFLLSSPPADLFGSPKSFTWVTETLTHTLKKKIPKTSDGVNIFKRCVGVLSDAETYRDHLSMSKFYITDELDKLTVSCLIMTFPELCSQINAYLYY